MTEEAEDSKVRRAIIDVVVDHYDLVAMSQEANRKVEVVSAAAQAESNTLRESLIKLQAQSNNMMSAGTVWRRKKQVLGNAVAQHQKLLALSEAASLVEECIRGEMYHEALMVMEHITRSHAYTQHHTGFFARLLRQMREVLDRSLEEIVLPRLSGPLSVDGAFKVATFLRRIGTPLEQLKPLFLERRASFINRMAAEAASSPVPYARMLKYVNLYKVHVGEVVMQYAACFPSASTGESGGEAWDETLRRWCHTQAERFTTVFAETVANISNGAELALAIEQCSSCSSNVAKLHLDVSPLLSSALAERVKAVFADHMEHATSAYAASMLTFSWRMPPTYSSAAYSGGGGSGSPPLVLAQWLPLAYALNGLLTAFNAIRKCLLPGIEPFCAGRVGLLVGRIASDLKRDGELTSTMEEAERAVYRDLVGVFLKVFVPHVMLCTERLLGSDAAKWMEESLAEWLNALSKQLPASALPPPSPPAPEAEEQVSPLPPKQQPEQGVGGSHAASTATSSAQLEQPVEAAAPLHVPNVPAAPVSPPPPQRPAHIVNATAVGSERSEGLPSVPHGGTAPIAPPLSHAAPVVPGAQSGLSNPFAHAPPAAPQVPPQQRQPATNTPSGAV